MAQPMLEAEVAQVLGTKGRHQAPRRAQRRGDQGGYVVAAGRRVQIQRPRVRPVDGQEVALRTPGLQQPDRLDEAAFERMLYGVASRHDAGGSPGPRRPRDRRRREEHREGRLRPGHRGLLQQVLQRPLTTRMRVLSRDAIVFGSRMPSRWPWGSMRRDGSPSWGFGKAPPRIRPSRPWCARISSPGAGTHGRGCWSSAKEGRRWPRRSPGSSGIGSSSGAAAAGRGPGGLRPPAPGRHDASELGSRRNRASRSPTRFRTPLERREPTG